ncbi:MAG: hypothetical protein NZM25_02965 [Leptospiraceae bacterium]|nr:hypothetical protein [Leptospiraceae bacterium]MDW8307230.1 hypothetical protein [Leptospiraceae bacterium]
MANEKFVRVYESFDPEELKAHTIVIDELEGQCLNCKTLGINYLKNKVCPSCQNEFRYVATNARNRELIIKILGRIRKEGLSLKLVEKEDLDKALARDALSDLFRKS